MDNKNKRKGWTSIEQCRSLMEAGLDPKTSDMFYAQVAEGLGDPFEWKVFCGKHPAVESNLFSFRNGNVIPCWSMGALIELMGDWHWNDKGYDMFLTVCGSYVKYSHFDMEHETNAIDEMAAGGSFTDNVVCMVLRLLEQGYIERKGE